MSIPGYMGKILRVDLDSGVLRDEMLPPESELRKYIGGLGLGAKILYEEVPPSVKPLDPENRLIFMTGPLGGTPAPSSGQCAVITLSAETGYTAGVAHFHGVMGSTLKYSGYDGIIIQGAAKSPVYLWVNNGKAELRDAGNFWGKDTHETYDLMREEVGEPEAAVACIGPAGEAMCHGASICTDYHHMASKAGVGTIMGSKKLKAIVLWGTQGVKIADPDMLLEERIAWQKDAWAPGAISGAVGMGAVTRVWYGPVAGEGCWLAFKNFTDPEAGRDSLGKSIIAAAKKTQVRPQGSFSCPIACSYTFMVPEGPYKGYVATPGGGGENIEGASGLMGVCEPGTNYWLTDFVDRMGWDSAAPGQAMAMLFELYERGRLTKKDTGGLELKWGNADAVHKLFQQTIKREGLGQYIAQGPGAVADHFKCQDLAIHVKGTGWNIHDWRGLWGTVFSYGVASAGPCHQGIGPEVCPETDLGYDAVLPPHTDEGKAEATRRAQIRKHWDDSNGVCWFVAVGVPNVTTHSARSVTAVTGWKDLTKSEAWEIGERILNLLRCFSIRRGHTPAGDLDYGGRILEAPVSGPAKGLTVAPYLKGMLTEYYTLLGWDPETGKPKEETLHRLGLDQQAKDIAAIKIPVKVQDVVLRYKESGKGPEEKRK